MPSHAHAHDHGHSHGAVTDTADSRRRVMIAALLTFSFMLVEVIGGILSGSLALLADAAHMLTDAGALAIAWVGFKLSERPADPERSYGFHRVKILAAFINGFCLLLLGAWIIWEAIERLISPHPVQGGLLMAVAVIGLFVNIAAFLVLHGGDREDLNMRGALWHVAGDLLGSLAAIAAGAVILLTGWMPIDPILSAVVALLIVIAGVRLLRQTGHILLEGTPEGLSSAAMKKSLMTHVDGIAAVSHVHAWSLNEARPLVTLEVTATPGACVETLRRAVKAHLAEAFDVSHTTVEVHSEPADAENTQA